MASAPPLPTEFHRLVIVLDGKTLKGGSRARAARYYEYLTKIRKLAEREFGAKIHSKELHLKPQVIKTRERRAKKLAKRKRG
jgi:hypothetical protein